jgi:hypothetical protein
MVTGPFRRLNTVFGRFAETVEIYTIEETGTNDFGNPVHDWNLHGTTEAIITREGSPFEMQGGTGEYDVEQPYFYFQHGAQPEIEDPRIKRVEADGSFYELGAVKEHRSHIETKGSLVRDDIPVEKES